MPDVKAVPCDLSPLAPPATRGMDLERCLGELQGSLSVLGTPLSAFPHASAPYPTLEIPPAYNNNNPPLLSNLGVRYCSPSSGPPSAKHPHDAPPCPTQGHYGQGYLPQGYASSPGSRLYHSLENLHWATAVSDPTGCALGAPYRSVDSELILHYTSSSHWCNGPGVGTQVYGVAPGPDGLACCQRRGPPRKDLPAIPQWLLPSAVEDYGLNGNIRKGLREKLRLQSTRVAEPHKPMRPHAPPGHAAPPPSLPSDHDPGAGAHLGPARGQGGICARRITSPEEIKQEVLRRLQLRRQRSTPNLALASSCPEPGGVSTSLTSEPVSSCASFLSTTEQARRRPPVGRLHIPTFEEFKKMRQRENQQNQDAPTAPASGRSGGDGDERGQGEGESVGAGEQAAAQAEMENGSPAEVHSAADAQNRDPSLGAAADPRAGPICTSPAPRSPLPSLAAPSDPSRAVQPAGPGAPDAMALPFPPLREGVEGPSSCCPGILLDGSELSSYGATISRMRDGLLGSALDLFKKSCSAEIAESPVRLSHDQGDGADITASQPAGQSAAVSMTTSARETEASVESSTGEGGEREEPTECHPGAGCRRSSSDAAYELSASVKAERECRLRPHFSDPMPADAAKRKQLEMKMAAVARLHSQRRDRENGPVLVRGRSEPRGGERGDRPGGGGGRTGRAGQHRWSTVSTLSADSGVVGGLSDDREDEDEPHRARRCAGGGRRGAEVERADSGIGSGLARGWKRPTATLASWETHRPCLDCGQQDDDGGGGRAEPMCERCSKLRTERKEAILEFLNTECSYGEDLRIIREEFYCPMQSAGLLTAEQLTVVFSNVQELMEVNDRFTEHLQDSIDHALDQGDEDLQTVCIGEIFLEFVNMLPAFQTYCLQQCSSVNMLNTLEKEKELLRIFLDVSQNDNTALRRMNLRSFLMAPLQRVTKYPLLLSRISKATGENHLDRGRLHEAKSRVESHLEHINMRSKQEGTASWSLRSFRRDSRKTRRAVDIELREVSLRAVGWARDGTRFVMEGPLQLSQPADGQWVKKGSRSLKFQNVQGLLLVRTQPGGEALAPAEGGQKGALLQEEDAAETVRDGALVLIKDKGSGKFTVLREPVRLGNCVVSSEPDCEDTFEILDIRREAFVFRAADKSRTQQWYRQIKRYAGDLGPWRKRRNALPNIMISTTQSRS